MAKSDPIDEACRASRDPAVSQGGREVVFDTYYHGGPIDLMSSAVRARLAPDVRPEEVGPWCCGTQYERINGAFDLAGRMDNPGLSIDADLLSDVLGQADRDEDPD